MKVGETKVKSCSKFASGQQDGTGSFVSSVASHHSVDGLDNLAHSRIVHCLDGLDDLAHSRIVHRLDGLDDLAHSRIVHRLVPAAQPCHEDNNPDRLGYVSVENSLTHSL